MFSANDLYSLTDFQRNAKEYVERLAETKRPMGSVPLGINRNLIIKHLKEMKICDRP